MGQHAIVVEGLGKEYVLGERERYKTLRSAVASWPRRRAALGRGGQAAGGSTETLWALRDVHFELDQGEVLGVIGHNGAGKSTLLKILARVTAPSTGRATILGRAGALLEVGTGFHPELTGRENVFVNGSILGISRAELVRRFDDIVAFAEIERFIDTPVKRYSSGMQVRLAFAIAAHIEPEIMIVDEVLAVGDAEFQRRCLGQLSGSARGGRTVLFVSHNLPAVRSLCTRAIVLDHGTVVFDGEPGEAIHHYLASRQVPPSGRSLRDAPRTMPTASKARLTGLRIHASGSHALIGVGETLRLTIDFEVHEPIYEPTIRLNINSFDELLVAQASSAQHEAPLSRLDPGHYVVEATIEPVLLQPGDYGVSLAIRDARALQDFVSHAGSFCVFETAELSSPWHNAPGGYLRLPVDWAHPVRAEPECDR